MLVAAAEPLGDPALLFRAGRQLDIGTGALAPAETAELLEIGTRVQFRHPLVRSAVYRAAPLVSRQRAHEALAEVSHPDDDADRRAWHRALAAAGPDEDVAAELEQSAGRAQARGGVAATAAFLQRAAALTPDPARRGGRALAAAHASVQSGAFTAARGLLATAEAGPLDEFQRARIDLLRAQLAFVSSRGTDATPLLLAAARRLEALDISVARETYVDAFSAALFGARLNGSIDARAVAKAARAASHPRGAEPATADLLLDALVALADDYATAVPLCREAVQRLSGEKASANDRLRWLWQGCVVAFEIWDDEHAGSLSRSSVEIARATGTLERPRARSQRPHTDARALRRARRRRSDGFRDSVGRGGDGDPCRTLRRVDGLGVARQAARNDRPHRDDGARGGRSRRGDRIGCQCVRARGPLQRPGPV